MIISPSRNFIFIHLEKCGGTSIEVALEPYLEWGDLIVGSTEYGERQQALYFEKYGIDNVKENMFWKHSVARDICGHLGREQWDSFNKISVVRNPMTLMESLYFFARKVIELHIGRFDDTKWRKLIRTNHMPTGFPYSEKYVEAYMRSRIENSGFDGFVNYLFKHNFMFVQPQFDRIRGYAEQKELGLVIELSQLNDRWQEVLDLIGIEEEVPLDTLNISVKQEINYSNKTEQLIKRHFAIDYQELPRYTGVNW